MEIGMRGWSMSQGGKSGDFEGVLGGNWVG